MILKPYLLILKFYLIYFIMCLIGNIFINYNSLSLYSVGIAIIYVFFITSGALIGFSSTDFKIKFLGILKIKNVILSLFVILTFTIFYSWYLNIQYYGSLDYIIANAFLIRINIIGQEVSIIPKYLTYSNSLVHAALVLSLVYYECTKKNKYIIFSIYFFILIVLCDLLTFGRIGILYGIFIIIGYLIVYKKFKFNIKNMFFFIILFLILILPRLIRGSFDNMSETVSGYTPYLLMEIPSFLYSVLTVYIYYFSSIYAFDIYINEIDHGLTYGFRMFTPIANLLNNILGLERMNTIDSMVNIPFEYNIYSILRDIYSDYRLVGIVTIPIIVGIWFGFVFKKQTIYFDAIKIYSLGWLFYTPIFNVFSFGSFLISFLFLFVLIFFRSDYNERN